MLQLDEDVDAGLLDQIVVLGTLHALESAGEVVNARKERSHVLRTDAAQLLEQRLGVGSGSSGLRDHLALRLRCCRQDDQ